jgi:hypothetical protein
VNPTAAFDVAKLALDCVCEQMELVAVDDATYPGCPQCRIYVSAGEPPIDCCTNDCQGGMLTVHIEDFFPSNNVPVAATDFEPCKAASWVVSLVITSARCAPTMDENGNEASDDDLTANARLMAIDQYAILTALGCCLVSEAPANKRRRRVLIGGSRPLVSDGACAAVEVRALVEVGNVCGCSEVS